MATTTTAVPGTEYDKDVRRPPASGCKGSPLDTFLRVVLLGASVAAVAVMVTSKESKVFQVQVPGVPTLVPFVKYAKFNYSPAFIYFVVALSVAGLHSIISGLASMSAACKPSVSPKLLLVLIITDALVLGIVASATGTAGGVAYVGLKGNAHVNWGKICDNYGKFCRHVGSAVGVSLFASVVLLLLILINSTSLYRAIHRSH